MYQKRNNNLDVVSLYSGDYNARFYLREISKLAKLPLKTCQNTLVNLEREKILRSKTEGKNKYFSLNLENINVKSYLLKAEIYKTDLFLEKYSEFKTFLKAINTNSTIIIFGSFASFKADKNSDLDLFIITNKEEKLPYHLLPHKIHQNSLKEESFRKALLQKETLLKEIEANHIILNNPFAYVNIFWEYYGNQKA
jgi:predicted nucleotidyltransferase